jgi:Tat protein translocase TatB subunit
MSIPHLIVIALIALIVLGPEKLPQVARTAGKMMAELRRITGDFQSTIEREVRDMEREVALKDIRKSFPEHVHYDLQNPESTLPASFTDPHAPAEPAAATAAETAVEPKTPTEAAPTPGKPDDGKHAAA